MGDAQCGNAKDLSADEQSDLENLTRVCNETFYCFDKILSYFKGNVPYAEATLRRFCGADDMQSCFYLGMFDQVTFRGRPQNLAKALALYNYACRNGFANGCVRLAMMYDAGADVTRDERTAADYFHKAQALYQQACDANEAVSCTLLAIYYQDDALFVAKDDAKAEALYRKACALGNNPACQELNPKQ